jgi:hypothetical protein
MHPGVIFGLFVYVVSSIVAVLYIISISNDDLMGAKTIQNLNNQIFVIKFNLILVSILVLWALIYNGLKSLNKLFLIAGSVDLVLSVVLLGLVLHGSMYMNLNVGRDKSAQTGIYFLENKSVLVSVSALKIMSVVLSALLYVKNK